MFWTIAQEHLCHVEAVNSLQVTELSLISSANIKRGLETNDGNSFTYKANNRGPSKTKTIPI